MMAPGATAEQIQDKILPLTTGEAQERVKTEAEATVKMVQENQFSNMRVQITAVMVEAFTKDTATTVVAASLSGSSALQAGGGSAVFLLDLDLVKQDGKWLVSRMTPVNGAEAGQAGTQGGAGGIPGQGGSPAPGGEGQPQPAPGAENQPEPVPGG